MDRRQLQIFLQVARCHSFTRAAEELHMAQPAVSIAVRKLEQELDTALLQRGDRRVSLTEAGRALSVRAARILEEFAQAKAEIADLQALKTGQVRLDTPAMLGSYFFPHRLRAFRQAYPGINLRISAEGTGRAEQMLIDGSIDMAVVNVAQHSEQIESRPLSREPVVLCMAPDHPLAGRETVSAGDLQQQPLIVYHQGYHLRQILNRLLGGAPANIILETDILRLMVELVAAGQGLSLCLQRLVDKEEHIVGRPFNEPQLIELGIGWKRGAHLSQANRAFVEFMIGEQV
ncbi:MAG: LysR family transcriptional regulator [Cellvibrionaceae bacterium]|nr:LysR family transcriptional regulator [Cellvibrionaceae bacterium]MCV6626205.1 LysR family transcriptional regulator [Cellvibrionaceae bacterium]